MQCIVKRVHLPYSEEITMEFTDESSDGTCSVEVNFIFDTSYTRLMHQWHSYSGNNSIQLSIYSDPIMI